MVCVGVFRVQADGLGKGRDGGVILLLLETGQTLLVGFRPGSAPAAMLGSNKMAANAARHQREFMALPPDQSDQTPPPLSAA